jgi:hypothetical protein
VDIPDLHVKTIRLVEMGFDRENVVRALVHYKGDEQAAAEAILTGTAIPEPGSTPAQAQPQAQAQALQSQQWSGEDSRNQGPPSSSSSSSGSSGSGGSGFFGKMWGKR